MKTLVYLVLMLVLSSCAPALGAQPSAPAPASNASLAIPENTRSDVDMTKIKLSLTGRVLINTSQAVYLANADGGSPVLIHIINSPVSMMSLSPDGTKLAYFQDNYLYVQDVETRNIKQLNQDIIGSIGGQLRWSPDGKKIALSCSTPSNPISSICLIDSDSGKTEILISQKFLGEIRPSHFVELQDWSRDGSRMVFTYYTPSEKGQKQDFAIYLYNTSLATTQMILDSQKQDLIKQIRGATISPDNTTLLISGIGVDSSFQVFRLDLQTADLSQLEKPENYSYSIPVWGSDSSYFYVHLEQGMPLFKEDTAVLDTNGNILSVLDIRGAVVEWMK